MKVLITSRFREFFLAITVYVVISVFFLFQLINSHGDVAQQDWGIPITASAAQNDFRSSLFVWQYNGFGATTRIWGFPFFTFLNASLAPLGFVGGTEIKLLSVFLIALAGIAMYILARKFGLGLFSSFLSGLFFMTTPVVFNWLMFGWIYYLLAYALLPLMILVTKKFLEANDVRYILINAIILGLAFEQPTFILFYPLLGFIFVLFESKANLKIVLRGFIFIIGSLSIYLLTALNFFTSINAGTFSFYQGSYYGVILAQFNHLGSIINPIRLWGSTFNYQFETYFPKDLVLLSFVPVIVAMIGVLLRPRDRRVLFFFLTYLFVFVAYESYVNLHFLVYNVPYGSIFEAPSIFLAPAGLGLALLIGNTNQTVSRISIRFRNAVFKRIVPIICSVIILILIISAGIPWWTGQTSGEPLHGPPTKLNLYQIPSSYVNWNSVVAANDEYFVLYLPVLPGNAQIANTSYFSQVSEGVNGGIFTNVNDLPYVSASNTTLFLNQLLNGDSDLGERWGLCSIKYIVLYTNVQNTDQIAYNMTDIMGRLSQQSGIVETANFPDVVVFQNTYAKPVVYSNSLNATTKIAYHDPTSYRVEVTSTSPYLLVLNQAYSTSWTAFVNNTLLSANAHTKDDNDFNCWYVNCTGTMTIDIYYEPQTIYFVSTLISSGVLAAVLFCLVFATVIRVWRGRKKGKIKKII
jgi:hypothetical protein